MNQKALLIRAKKLGLLLYDSRLASRRTIDECAQAMGVTSEVYQSYETGMGSPSLPEIEALAYSLDIPVEHFWGNQSLSEKKAAEKPKPTAEEIPSRTRTIGAQLQQARLAAPFEYSELSTQSGIPEDILAAYESGEKAVPLPELELLVHLLGRHMDEFMDRDGMSGQWRKRQRAIQNFAELPPEMQEFIGKPINRPYLELVMRLSDLPAERLRAIAEGLLEITY